MINRLPSRVLNWDSPYTILYKRDPSLSVLRPFGCLAYAINSQPLRNKFDSRSLKCIFLGFDAHHKGYLLFDLDNSKISISRDVKFNVDTFPLAKTTEIPASHPSIEEEAVSSPQHFYTEDVSPPITNTQPALDLGENAKSYDDDLDCWNIGDSIVQIE